MNLGPMPSDPNDIVGTLHVGTAANGDLRWALADMTPLVEEMRILRDLSPLAAIGLGQLLTAAVLLTRLVSKDPLRLVLEVRGDGPLGHVRAEADTLGRVRGLVERRLAERPPATSGHSRARHSARCAWCASMRTTNYESRVSLVDGGVARNVVHFLEQSEQIRSAVMLGVLARPERCGGRRRADRRGAAGRRLDAGPPARSAHPAPALGERPARGRRPLGSARQRHRRRRA